MSASRCQVWRVQAEVALGLVAGEDLEVIGGQLLVVRQQLRVAAVEYLVQAGPCVLVGLGAHQADQLAVDQVHPLQPFQRQVATQEAGGAG